MNGADETIFEQAAHWHLAIADDRMDWDSFTRWLEADPRNREAYDRIAFTDAALDEHRSALSALCDETPLRRNSPKWPLWFGGALAASLAILLIVPQFIAPQAAHKALAFIALGSLFNVNSVAINAGWALAAAWLAARGSVQAGMRWLDRAAGAMFVGFGVKLAVTENPVS